MSNATISAMTLALDNAQNAEGRLMRSRELRRVHEAMLETKVPAAHPLWEALHDAYWRDV